jgi:hypothetical protein
VNGFDPEAVAHQIAEASATMRQVLTPVEEAALGYRKHLEQQGWSSATAEKMALRFYETLMSHVGAAQR